MLIDCHNHLGVELGAYLRGEFPYAQHLETLVREGQAHGIERFIVFPMVSNFAMNLAALRRGEISLEGSLESVPYAFENRRMLREIYEFFPEEGRAAIPFAFFDPFRKVQAQIDELGRLKRDYIICGLKTQTTMLQSPITSLREEGRAFLDLAREWDVPLLIHSSVLPSDIWAQAQDIVDIAEQNPDVRFNAAHSCRFDHQQLHRIAALPNIWFDCSAHVIHCALAAKNSPVVAPIERRFQSDYNDAGQVLRDLANAFPEKLMWGSDSPYYSFVANVEGKLFSLLSSYAEEADALHRLPESLKQRVAGDNICAWLGPNFVL